MSNEPKPCPACGVLAVGTGFVTVPREPTEAMIEAGEALIPWAQGTESRRGVPSPETVYATMLAAAPEYPVLSQVHPQEPEKFPAMEAVDQFGWCGWVRPLPGYRMQCCGCDLVHELDLAIIEDVNLKADGSWDARSVAPEGWSAVFRMRRSACPDPSMGKHACTNRAQCWEPCGDLGNDDRYVGKADPEVSAAVDRALGIDRT